MQHDCFRDIGFQRLSQLVQDRTLAFNLLMPTVKPKRSRNRLSLLFGLSLIMVNVILVHAFFTVPRELIEAWHMVGMTWPYLLVGGLGILALVRNKKDAFGMLRPLSGELESILFWIFMGLMELALVASVFRTTGFYHSAFLVLTVIFGAVIIFTVWGVERGYLAYDSALDRQSWLVSMVPKEELRLVFQRHHLLKQSIRYQHHLYPVPNWPNEKIDELVERLWLKVWFEKNRFVAGEVGISLAFIMGLGSAKGFRQLNGVPLPLFKGATEWTAPILELLIFLLFLVGIYSVFVECAPFEVPLAMFIIHLLYTLFASGLDRVLLALVVGYVVLLWKGLKNGRQRYDFTIVDQYWMEILRGSNNHPEIDDMLVGVEVKGHFPEES